MRNLLAPLCFAIAFSCLSQSNNVALNWPYSINELQLAEGFGSPYHFKIYSSPHIPVTNWTLIYDKPWTNTTVITNDGNYYYFTVQVTVAPVGEQYFVATASNFWGESFNSNTTGVPPVASVLQTKISKTISN